MRKKTKLMKYYFRLATAHVDPFATLAGFELAVYWFNRKKELKAMKWLDYYLKRDSRGIHSKQAFRMQKTIQQNKKFFIAKGVDRPNPEKLRFKHSKLSIVDQPHYYYANIGHLYTQFDGFGPKDNGVIVATGDASFGITTDFGIGFGPIKSGNTEGTIGYSYQQAFETNIDRLTEYFDDPLDFGLFPYRLDLMLRSHRFMGDFKASFGNNFYVGGYGELNFTQIGSHLATYVGTDIKGDVFSVSDETSFRPVVGYIFNSEFETEFHLLFHKFIDNETPEFSNQSYNFSDDFIDFQDKFSFGLKGSYKNPKYKLNASAQFFRYSYTYNDLWRDHVRLGGQIHVDHELIPNLLVHLNLGFYTDIYRLEITSQNDCVFNEEGSKNATAVEDASCIREDTGFYVGLNAFYDVTEGTRIGFEFKVNNNASEAIKLFDRQDLSIHFHIGWAFPHHQPVYDLTDKFIDDLYVR